jgi:hypothetical protein
MRRYNVRERGTCTILDQRTVESNTITWKTINGKFIQSLSSISEFNGHKEEIDIEVRECDMDTECTNQESMILILVSPP